MFDKMHKNELNDIIEIEICIGYPLKTYCDRPSSNIWRRNRRRNNHQKQANR